MRDYLNFNYLNYDDSHSVNTNFDNLNSIIEIQTNATKFKNLTITIQNKQTLIIKVLKKKKILLDIKETSKFTTLS